MIKTQLMPDKRKDIPFCQHHIKRDVSLSKEASTKKPKPHPSLLSYSVCVKLALMYLVI